MGGRQVLKRHRASGISLTLMIAFYASPVWSASIPSCRGVPNSTISQAEQSAKNQVCRDIAESAAGTLKTGNKFYRQEAKAVFQSLLINYNLPPFCAGSISAVLVQQLADGQLSAGSCPAP